MTTSTVVDLNKKRTENLEKTMVELILSVISNLKEVFEVTGLYHYDVVSKVTETLLDDGILSNYPIGILCTPFANDRITTNFQTNYHEGSVPVAFIRVVDRSGLTTGQDIYKIQDDEISLVIEEIINDPKYSDLIYVEVFKRLMLELSNQEVVCFSNPTTERNTDGEITVFSFDVLIHNQLNTVSVYPGHFIR